MRRIEAALETPSIVFISTAESRVMLTRVGP